MFGKKTMSKLHTPFGTNTQTERSHRKLCHVCWASEHRCGLEKRGRKVGPQIYSFIIIRMRMRNTLTRNLNKWNTRFSSAKTSLLLEWYWYLTHKSQHKMLVNWDCQTHRFTWKGVGLPQGQSPFLILEIQIFRFLAYLPILSLQKKEHWSFLCFILQSLQWLFWGAPYSSVFLIKCGLGHWPCQNDKGSANWSYWILIVHVGSKVACCMENE